MRQTSPYVQLRPAIFSWPSPTLLYTCASCVCGLIAVAIGDDPLVGAAWWASKLLRGRHCQSVGKSRTTTTKRCFSQEKTACECRIFTTDVAHNAGWNPETWIEVCPWPFWTLCSLHDRTITPVSGGELWPMRPSGDTEGDTEGGHTRGRAAA